MNKSFRDSLSGKTHVSRHPIRVLYEDEHYVVFDKPSGLLVIPTAKNEQATLVNIANQQYSEYKGSWRLHPCHRIDRETSGAIIFAKGKLAQRLMMDLFKKKAVTKKYIALVHGELAKASGELRKPLEKRRPQSSGGKRSCVEAITRYKVSEVRQQFSIVEVWPVTGRTNQIRIHFSQVGHPLVGERKFAFGRDYALKFRRSALHAAYLEWIHPVSGKRVGVKSDLPKDIRQFINQHEGRTRLIK